MGAKRVLIVEDEQIVAEELRRSLATNGYEVTGIAQTGAEAISEAGKIRPDLVIMDIVLRGAMDGISAAGELLPLGIPVLFLTGYSDRHLIDRAQHTQPVGYILKPAKAGELTAVVQLALYKRTRKMLVSANRESGSPQRAGLTSSSGCLWPVLRNTPSLLWTQMAA